MMLTKQKIQTSSVEDFFARARGAAQKADRGQSFSGAEVLSFEDPARMFAVLSEARRAIMAQVMQEPKSVSELADALGRNRSAITKDVHLLEQSGLLDSLRLPNPGHGVRRVVRAKARRIELTAVLE
jgi:predicted transcriptional regulator